MANPPSSADLEQQQQALLASLPALPRFYANSFGIIQTASDVSVVLLTNGSPGGILSMSHISAKSLANELDKAIKDFESATKQKVKTISEISGELSTMSKSNV